MKAMLLNKIKALKLRSSAKYLRLSFCNRRKFSNFRNHNSKSNQEIVQLLQNGELRVHQLELYLTSKSRCAEIRREYYSEALDTDLGALNQNEFDYDSIYGKNIENAVGFVSVPVGIVGPLKLNGEEYFVPMATTEGCLVASTQRGCKSVSVNGATSVVFKDGMTRAPLLDFGSVEECKEVCEWIDDNFLRVKEIFDGTSEYAQLEEITTRVVGRKLFTRFRAHTGSAMGMNMVSKGCEAVLGHMQEEFPDMEVSSISGNYCSDKKPAAVNWILGRGKSVVCESVIPGWELEETYGITSAGELAEMNTSKNLVGSAAAGALGGFNAHASNIVSAIFLACGQDIAQNVESSHCITTAEAEPNGDLYFACSMPCIEVGTVGGGTGLAPQRACLDVVGVDVEAEVLAKVVCAAVLCGELSLLAALKKGELVKSHMKYNR